MEGIEILRISFFILGEPRECFDVKASLKELRRKQIYFSIWEVLYFSTKAGRNTFLAFHCKRSSLCSIFSFYFLKLLFSAVISHYPFLPPHLFKPSLCGRKVVVSSVCGRKSLLLSCHTVSCFIH